MPWSLINALSNEKKEHNCILICTSGTAVIGRIVKMLNFCCVLSVCLLKTLRRHRHTRGKVQLCKHETIPTWKHQNYVFSLEMLSYKRGFSGSDVFPGGDALSDLPGIPSLMSDLPKHAVFSYGFVHSVQIKYWNLKAGNASAPPLPSPPRL